LIRSGLRLRNVFDLPRTAHSGNDRGWHIISSYSDSMRALLGQCMISDAQLANHTPMLRCTVRWRIVGITGSNRRKTLEPLKSSTIVEPVAIVARLICSVPLYVLT